MFETKTMDSDTALKSLAHHRFNILGVSRMFRASSLAAAMICIACPQHFLILSKHFCGCDMQTWDKHIFLPCSSSFISCDLYHHYRTRKTFLAMLCCVTPSCLGIFCLSLNFVIAPLKHLVYLNEKNIL